MASKALPEVEVYARPFGYLQWICPNCQEIFGAKQISGRKARIRCTNCARVYRLGLGFNPPNNLLPPWNARECCDLWNGYTTNRTEVPVSRMATARFRGRLDWVCPSCQQSQSQGVGRDLMDINCAVCGKVYFLNVIFWAGKVGTPVTTPLDWSIPNSYETPSSPLNSLPPPTTGAGQ